MKRERFELILDAALEKWITATAANALTLSTLSDSEGRTLMALLRKFVSPEDRPRQPA